MSKLSLTPNGAGTGTYTLASPNNNASHTLTLPVATGTLLTTTGDGSGLTGIGGSAQTVDVFTSSGTYTKPAGLVAVKVTVVGGGGGGGFLNNTAQNNGGGGGGAAAMNYFMSRPADGNTILTFTVGHAITMAMGKTKLKIEDMAPIARGTNDPQILMVNCKTTPYKTPESFLAGMKKGDKISFGGTHTGTIDHITAYLWAKKTGQKMPKYIPFKGGGELATQVVAGSVDVGILNLSEAGAPIEAGDLCPLIILGKRLMATKFGDSSR